MEAGVAMPQDRGTGGLHTLYVRRGNQFSIFKSVLVNMFLWDLGSTDIVRPTPHPIAMWCSRAPGGELDVLRRVPCIRRAPSQKCQLL